MTSYLHTLLEDCMAALATLCMQLGPVVSNDGLRDQFEAKVKDTVQKFLKMSITTHEGISMAASSERELAAGIVLSAGLDIQMYMPTSRVVELLAGIQRVTCLRILESICSKILPVLGDSISVDLQQSVRRTAQSSMYLRFMRTELDRVLKATDYNKPEIVQACWLVFSCIDQVKFDVLEKYHRLAWACIFVAQTRSGKTKARKLEIKFSRRRNSVTVEKLLKQCPDAVTSLVETTRGMQLEHSLTGRFGIEITILKTNIQEFILKLQDEVESRPTAGCQVHWLSYLNNLSTVGDSGDSNKPADQSEEGDNDGAVLKSTPISSAISLNSWYQSVTHVQHETEARLRALLPDPHGSQDIQILQGKLDRWIDALTHANPSSSSSNNSHGLSNRFLQDIGPHYINLNLQFFKHESGDPNNKAKLLSVDTMQRGVLALATEIVAFYHHRLDMSFPRSVTIGGVHALDCMIVAYKISRNRKMELHQDIRAFVERIWKHIVNEFGWTDKEILQSMDEPAKWQAVCAALTSKSNSVSKSSNSGNGSHIPTGSSAAQKSTTGPTEKAESSNAANAAMSSMTTPNVLGHQTPSRDPRLNLKIFFLKLAVDMAIQRFIALGKALNLSPASCKACVIDFKAVLGSSGRPKMMRNRKIDHIVMCVLYARTRLDKMDIKFHTIAKQMSELPQYHLSHEHPSLVPRYLAFQQVSLDDRVKTGDIIAFYNKLFVPECRHLLSSATSATGSSSTSGSRQPDSPSSGNIARPRPVHVHQSPVARAVNVSPCISSTPASAAHATPLTKTLSFFPFEKTSPSTFGSSSRASGTAQPDHSGHPPLPPRHPSSFTPASSRSTQKDIKSSRQALLAKTFSSPSAVVQIAESSPSSTTSAACKTSFPEQRALDLDSVGSKRQAEEQTQISMKKQKIAETSN